jgi:hypothetical protein
VADRQIHAGNTSRFSLWPMKRKLAYARLLLLPAVALLISGCSGGTSSNVRYKNGVAYGKIEGNFRHRWWNYYERGLSFAEGQFYLEAASDLTKALTIRGSDQRMARTYGHHFIDYFPNRELGIIHYLSGELQKARDSLERSIDQYPSSKAHFYLDRVRKTLIEEQAFSVAPPRLVLDLSAYEFWTRDDPVIISGKAEDRNFVSKLFIDGHPFYFDGAEKTISFSKSLALVQGRHCIEIAAMNLADKSSKIELIIHVDRQGPMIILDNLPSAGSLLQGAVHDESGAAELFIDGHPVLLENAVDPRFSYALPAGAETISFLAKDRLGNIISSEVRLQELTAKPDPVLLATTGPVDVRLLAKLFSAKTRQDKRAPVITIDKLTEHQTVYLEKFYLEGRIRDESNITRLAVNGAPILRKEGRLIFFNHIVELHEGDNHFIIEAEDEKGNKASKRITLKKETPEIMLPDERMRLSVLPYKRKGTVSDASLSFQDNLISALFDENRFQVIERDLLDTVLQEHALNRSKLVDKNKLLASGEIVSAQSIISGSIIETYTGIEIVSRMIDTETAEIIATEDVYSEVKDLPAIKELAQGTAIKFHNAFPLITGDIIEAMKRDVIFNIGKNRLRLNRRVIVYKETPVIHPESGYYLGANSEIVDHARVTQVSEEISKGQMNGVTELNTDSKYKVITE